MIKQSLRKGDNDMVDLSRIFSPKVKEEIKKSIDDLPLELKTFKTKSIFTMFGSKEVSRKRTKSLSQYVQEYVVQAVINNFLRQESKIHNYS